ncbi:hypothetical protein ACIRPK_22620 [Kitasatospora sp. NPDC101801]|uniref:hypothetical protein n=1 Tax=Kitasatospora sp. NPDC101801 TaxID=3364103 RepID=UPI003826DC8F
MTQGRRSRRLTRFRKITSATTVAAPDAEPKTAPRVPVPGGYRCCATTLSEHITLGGTVVRTRRHQPACTTWSARY